MASFYSDAFLYKQPLTTTQYSTTISLPKFRLRRRLSTVRLGNRSKPRPQQQSGRRSGFSLSRLLKRGRCKWLELRYASILRRLKEYYRSLIKDTIEGSSRSSSMEQVYQQQRVLRDSSSLISAPNYMGVTFSNFHGGATLTTPKSILI